MTKDGFYLRATPTNIVEVRWPPNKMLTGADIDVRVTVIPKDKNGNGKVRNGNLVYRTYDSAKRDLIVEVEIIEK